MVKIGRTNADIPSDRASGLYTTGVPLPFEVEFAARVVDTLKVEKVLHNAFKDKRVNPKREFFRIDPDQAIQILELLDVEDATEEVRAEVTATVGLDETAASNKFKSRRPPMNFEEMGIPIGSLLSLNRDPLIQVKVVEPKRVEHEGEAVGISRATRDLLGYERHVAPQPHWSYEGRTLTEIYDETYPQIED